MWSGGGGLHTLLLLHHSDIRKKWLAFYLCRELNILNVQGTHDTEKETSTTDYNSILWIIPVMVDSYSMGVDFNKEHLTLYISIYTNPFSKQGISVTFVWKITTFPNGYRRAGCEGACFIKSGAQCYLQLVATLTKWEKYLPNRPEKFAGAMMTITILAIKQWGSFCHCVTLTSYTLYFPLRALEPSI